MFFSYPIMFFALCDRETDLINREKVFCFMAHKLKIVTLILIMNCFVAEKPQI